MNKMLDTQKFFKYLAFNLKNDDTLLNAASIIAYHELSMQL